MSTRDKIKGNIINFILSEYVENRTEFFHRIKSFKKEAIYFYYNFGDYHSYLLLTLLQNFHKYSELEIKIILIPHPKGEFDLVPDLRGDWDFRDSKTLSSFWELENNILENIENLPDLKRDHISMAESIAIKIIENKKSPDHLKLIKKISDALLSNDRETLNKLKKIYGKVDEVFREDYLKKNQKNQIKKGQYQSGVLSHNGIWYWGLDRIPFLEKRLKKRGLYKGSILKQKKEIFTKEKSLILKNDSINLDFYFSFRSPYSYISLDRVFNLEKKYKIKLNIKPVLPMVMRGLPVPSQKGLYIIRDTSRLARVLNIPFGKISDPVGKGVENCMALYQFVKDNGKEREFLLSATKGCWSESLNLADPKDLKKVISRIGLNFDSAKGLLEKENWREMTSKNQKELEELGLWGVPSFHYKGQSFWGQDRISFLEILMASSS
ncbi:MAG: hypothetical protein CME68_05630 [Halobacteriovoraceae bacterium]|nr:hypothetical protein [Halobacteriovoraceae bacterium]|tara:strand:- start:301 stop:1614 length:1314 start_codon:yes stop_codon:yes gene_type:complete